MLFDCSKRKKSNVRLAKLYLLGRINRNCAVMTVRKNEMKRA